MKFYFITIVQMVMILLTVVRENHASTLTPVPTEMYREVQCYWPHLMSLGPCSTAQTTIQILTARYWFFMCYQGNGGCTCPSMQPTMPHCQEDFAHHNDTISYQDVQACNGRTSCVIQMNSVQGKIRCLRRTDNDPFRWLSNYVSITYQCVKSNVFTISANTMNTNMASSTTSSTLTINNTTSSTTRSTPLNTNADSSTTRSTPMNTNGDSSTIESPTNSSTTNGTIGSISETASSMIKENMTQTDLASIVGGVVGGIVVLVIIAVIAVMVVKSQRKKLQASKQPSKQVEGDPHYHDIPDLQVTNVTARLQTAKLTEVYKELSDNSQYTNIYSSLSHDRHYASLKQDKKTNQNQKSLMTMQSKTSSNKGAPEISDYAKVDRKKKETIYFELESENIPTNKPIYAKVNNIKTEPNYFELEPQDGGKVSSNEKHDYFELESCDTQNEEPQTDTEVKMDHTYFELESGSAESTMHAKPGDNDYAYTYAQFSRSPSEKGTQEHDVNNEDNDIYNADKVEFIDNDVYSTT